MTLPSQQIGGILAAGWFGVLGAARTPQPIVTGINAEVTAFMSEPGLRDKLVAHGAEPMAAPPELLRKHLTNEVETWGRLIREVGLKVE